MLNLDGFTQFLSLNILKVFKRTKKNNYFLVGMEDSLCFSAGGGSALWIDAAFNFGHSNKCDTYGNGPLVSTSEFRIVDLELWCFDPMAYDHVIQKSNGQLKDVSWEGAAAMLPPSPSSRMGRGDA